jgi:uncharacterized flavoprotein (TIGR03862 family)
VILSENNRSHKTVAIIGGGPAGLMAAEVVASVGFHVSVYDAMPSVGRKFLLAGVGGMNITHSELKPKFLSRYSADEQLLNSIKKFDAEILRDWVHKLGIQTFVGSSGRVFPKGMKAAPLLRAWLYRLRELGVNFFPRHHWLGWADNINENKLLFSTQENDHITQKLITADATLLALGGASWPKLGSDGAWVEWLREKKVMVNPLLPSNCGFETAWSSEFREKFAGSPLQNILLGCEDTTGQLKQLRSEFVITQWGIEGTGVYALSPSLRDQINHHGSAKLSIDLLPDYSLEKIIQLLKKPQEKNSWSSFLRKQLNLSAVKLALIRELTSKETYQDSVQLANAIKKLSITLHATRPIQEAISSAGGVSFTAINSDFMLYKLPGVFCAGEMLDWDAPTGGYLLTGCLASGRAAGMGIVKYLSKNN